uniref:Insulin-induced gene protein n=1 Tax=Lynx canadensis TaxID=61383 RepID=A0A667HIQ7_LYNCA
MAEGKTESPGPKKRGPYISSITSRSVNLMIRGVVLFFIGVFLALVLNLLQIQRNVTLFPPDVIASIFSSAWWVPPCCGTASAVIGLLYPCIDRHLGEPHKFKREWSSVMRCVAVFVGINHASAKVDFDNNIQLSLTLAALSIGLWWTFDRSRSGFGLGVGIAFLATLVTQLLVYNGVYHGRMKLGTFSDWTSVGLKKLEVLFKDIQLTGDYKGQLSMVCLQTEERMEAIVIRCIASLHLKWHIPFGALHLEKAEDEQEYA